MQPITCRILMIYFKWAEMFSVPVMLLTPTLEMFSSKLDWKTDYPE